MLLVCVTFFLIFAKRSKFLARCYIYGRNSERDKRTDEARVLFNLPSYAEYIFIIVPAQAIRGDYI